jgi:C4-dicarboxylate-specific signal transduction histidine kinase
MSQQSKPSRQQSPDRAETPLARALDRNASVEETVKQSGAELFVISAVLKQEIPEHVQTGDVAQALQKTDELESKIQSSAEDLAHVNDLLEQEIDEQAKVERELAATKAALARAKDQRPAK